MKVKQIKIEFNVTPEIKRFVYVYLITTKTGCILVDSGVYGSQDVIEKAIIESGHQPEEVKAVFLTHAHPDHIGTTHYFREKYGAKIYASEGERPWIEDIDLQFRERPIPNFYKLAGESTAVDCVVKDGEEISICDDILVQVIGTPGHSVDEISYRIGNAVFIGDAVPVRGDIPILVHLENSKKSLATLERLKNVQTFYPAWDQTYSTEIMGHKIKDAGELLEELEKTVRDMDDGRKLPELTGRVCEHLHAPMWKKNPLFATTVACCRKEK